MLRLAGDCLGLVEDPVPHDEAVHLPAQHGLQVPGKALRRRVVGADDHQGQAKFIFQSRRQICPVYGGEAGNKRRKPSALQQRGEGGGFLMLQYLVYKYVHGADYST